MQECIDSPLRRTVSERWASGNGGSSFFNGMLDSNGAQDLGSVQHDDTPALLPVPMNERSLLQRERSERGCVAAGVDNERRNRGWRSR